MTSSSAQPVYSITLDNSDTITLSNITVPSGTCTVDTSSYAYCNYTSNITVSGLTTTQISALSSVNITGLDTSTFTFKAPEEFVDHMPSVARIKDMCDEYPGLKIAFEKFRTTYNLVKDDYDTPKDKRAKP